MEVILVIFMIFAGMLLAAVLMGIFAFTHERAAESQASETIDRDLIGASILFQLARLGGAAPARAADIVRERAGLPVAMKGEIDLVSWASAYARASALSQRERFLELAVVVATATGTSLPLAQYNALLDISFTLGFQTDALARMRAQHRFTYEDHAKRGRPRSADRGGGATPLFVREHFDPAAWLKVLGLQGQVSRRTIVSTYRRLAAEYHPDRFFDASPGEQQRAAGRFIEITEAYQKLLARYEELEELEKV